MLYCIFRDSGSSRREPVAGINEEPVAVISAKGLSAAISRVSLAGLTPDITRVLAYQRVVEAFHRSHAVIPMRYGSVYEEEARILRFLEENGPRLKSLLDELNGCVEMGVRVLFAETSETERQRCDGDFSRADIPKPGGSAEDRDTARRSQHVAGAGHAYLRKRRVYYGLDKTLIRQRDAMAERCLAAFAGLYVKFKREESASEPVSIGLGLTSPAARRSLLSFYFLVPRTSIELFRQAFRCLSSREPDRLLLSGPWAPYNFVTDDESVNR